MVFTGAYTYIQWALESTFGTDAITGAACGDKSVFGFEQRIGSLSFTNNKIPISQLGDVRLKTFAYGQTQGSFSVDFVLSNPWFFSLIGFKDVVTTGASAPYSHSYSIDTTTDTTVPQSFTTSLGLENGSADIKRNLIGGLVRSATINTSVGEVARVSLDVAYRNEALTEGSCVLDGCNASQSICQHIPFTFAHGTLELPNCTTIAEVQDVSITFNQNAEHLFGIGSSVATGQYRRLFEVTGSFRASWTCTTQLVNVFEQQKDTLCNTSPASSLAVVQPTLKLTFDNGLAGSSERKIIIALTDIAIDSHSINIEPNEVIFEDIPFQAVGATVTATNAVATAPAKT